MCETLGALGAQIEPLDDGLRISGGQSLTGGTVNSCGDHRIAMSVAIAALRASADVEIEDTGCTATSFPNFWELLTEIQP